MLTHIYQLLTELPHDENGIVYFDTPVKILAPGFMPDVNLWACCPTPAGDVMVMDVDHKWHKLEQGEKDAQVIEAVFQRVRFLKQQQCAKEKEAAL